MCLAFCLYRSVDVSKLIVFYAFILVCNVYLQCLFFNELADTLFMPILDFMEHHVSILELPLCMFNEITFFINAKECMFCVFVFENFVASVLEHVGSLV